MNLDLLFTEPMINKLDSVESIPGLTLLTLGLKNKLIIHLVASLIYAKILYLNETKPIKQVVVN